MAHRLALGEEEGWSHLKVWRPVPEVLLAILHSFDLSYSDLLLLQLERPVRLRHRLQDLGVLLEELVVDPPEASNVLLAAATSAAVVTHMESENVSREAIAVEVHGCCDLGASEANVLGPDRHSLLGRVTDVA